MPRWLAFTLLGCGGLFVLGVVVLFAVIVGVGIGTSNKAEKRGTTDEGATTNVPKKKEDTVSRKKYIPVVLRVSGQQGSRYRCTHFDISDDGRRIDKDEEGQLGSTPVEYKARVTDPDDIPYAFYASCSLIDLKGQIKAELLVNGNVVDSAETRPDPPGQRSVEASNVQVTYSPKLGGPLPSKANKNK